RNITTANGRPGSQGPTSSTSPGASGASGAGGTGSGAVNGTNASAVATLIASWKATRSPHLTSAYGRAQTIIGRLLGPGGVPIAGASIDLTATPNDQGARAAAMKSPRSGPDGRFMLRLPGGVSS